MTRFCNQGMIISTEPCVGLDDVRFQCENDGERPMGPYLYLVPGFSYDEVAHTTISAGEGSAPEIQALVTNLSLLCYA